MASQPPKLQPPVSGQDSRPAPQHFVPPSHRELRAQAVQRLQVGLFGLAAIVLIVGLASIINDRARMSEAETGKVASTASSGASPTTKTDPLADIGVVPATTPESKPSQSPAASPGTAH